MEELAHLFPPVASFLGQTGASAFIRLEAQQVDATVDERGGREHRRSAHWDVALSELSESQLAELRALCRDCDIHVAMSPDKVFRTSTWLPRAADPTTESVQYALMTDSPVKVEYIDFDWRLRPMPKDAPTSDFVEVDVALCRKSALDSVVEQLARCGLAPSKIGAISSDGAGLAFTLRRSPGLSGGKWIGTHRRKLLLALSVLFFAGGLVATAFYARWQERSLDAELAKMEAAHRGLAPLVMRQSKAALLRESLSGVTAAVPVAEVINEVASLIPPDAWLMEMRLDAGRLKVVGRAARPTELPGRFNASKTLQNVRLDAVSAGGGVDAAAVFEMSATVVPTR
jgi:hypothetical protein